MTMIAMGAAMLTGDLACMIAGARQQLDTLKAKTA